MATIRHAWVVSACLEEGDQPRSAYTNEAAAINAAVRLVRRMWPGTVISVLKVSIVETVVIVPDDSPNPQATVFRLNLYGGKE